ncbi:MAG: FAD-dependent oxidoreductase [Neomegalonema sp.]|nr:FAD-dependent oxidoreductase [Neomegalonema sp.]
MADRVIDTDLCVIGAGSGGLSVAAGAAQMGARVVLIERGEMGGDCLNTGCVPSKALLAAAKAAHCQSATAGFGVAPVTPAIDFAAVQAHVRDVIARIAPHDSQERFEGLGVTVLRESACFVSPREARAGEARIRAKRFVIATGSQAALPPIPGLAETPHLTNETLFSVPEQPAKLLIIGGGPIGLEMAQAHRRLGSDVTVLEAARALARDEPELAEIALAALRAEGVEIREGVTIESVAKAGDGSGVVIGLHDGSALRGSHLLVAAGRRPAIDGLGLDAAGIAYGPRGVEVDDRLRTSNKKVFAIGDVAIGPGAGLQFTHVAGYHAGVVIRNALFRIPAKASLAHAPWTTYTDPELAQVGLTERAAREAHGDAVEVSSWSLAENDRAQAERRTQGRVKVVLGRRGKILGAGIVGPQAGELIQVWALAISKGMKIKDIAGMIAPYPTLGEASKRAAGAYFAPKLFAPRTRWVVRQLLKLS